MASASTFTIAGVDRTAIYTKGTNLIEVLGNKNINFRRCYTNVLPEALEVLGIEATRQILLNELKLVFQATGDYISYKHYSCLIDLMTFHGNLNSISRHGFAKRSASQFNRISFEQSMDCAINASLGGTSSVDNMQGVSANITFSQVCPRAGTSAFELMIDDSLGNVKSKEIDDVLDEVFNK